MTLASIVRATATAALAAGSAIAFGEALAEEAGGVQPRPVQAVAGAAEQITLIMGKGGLFETSAPFAKISVADEKIIDVTPQSDREFVFTPKAVGATNVFVFSDKNTLIARLDVNVISQAVHAEGVREDTGKVRIYNDKKSLAKPALYRCSGTNCELEGEPPSGVAGMAATPAAEPGAAARRRRAVSPGILDERATLGRAGFELAPVLSVFNGLQRILVPFCASSDASRGATPERRPARRMLPADAWPPRFRQSTLEPP